MKRMALIPCIAASVLLGLAAPPLAAGASAASAKDEHSPEGTKGSPAKPAEKCLANLRVFDSQMEKDGFWLGSSGYGYGYPMGAFGYYGFGYPMVGDPVAIVSRYQNARPGYEVRVLVTSANILAQRGQEQQCENMLATTRDVYKLYLADMHKNGAAKADMPAWQQHQIATAEPVTSAKTSFRSDELIGVDVRDPQNQALGSVDDLVMSPKTGKIAYLVIARGGLFGIDRKYVPVPWEEFKIAPNGTLLVLDTTKDAMDDAPLGNNDQFATTSRFDQESQKVDAYWKVHLSSAGGTPPKG